MTDRPAASTSSENILVSPTVPLRNQFKLIEFAARELGDDALPARLSISAGFSGLASYGRQFFAAASLRAAIIRGNEICASTLQSATNMTLSVENGLARWTYHVAESEQFGRQKNSILAVGYMIDLLRHWAGPGHPPARVELPGRLPQGRSTIESLFGCEIRRADVTATVFPAELLAMPSPVPVICATSESHTGIPAPEDFSGYVRELVRLSLLDERPQRDWVAKRLNMSVRTLQRRLAAHGTSFAASACKVIEQQAAALLCNRSLSVSDVAYELGYSDPAHFTRAFTRQFGESPRAWRHRHGINARTPPSRRYNPPHSSTPTYTPNSTCENKGLPTRTEALNSHPVEPHRES